MTNVFKYFGIQDLRDLAERVLSGDPADLENRSALCRTAHQVTEATGTELLSLAGTLAQNWEGEASNAAAARLSEAGRKRHAQADRFLASATSFSVAAAALREVQAQAQALVDTAEDLSGKLDRALSLATSTVMPAAGAVSWGVKKLTGVDLKEKLEDAILELTKPILHEALGLNRRMATAIRNYEKVLRAESEVLRAMPGIVRVDAGPVDLPGDADLRRGALFRARAVADRRGQPAGPRGGTGHERIRARRLGDRSARRSWTGRGQRRRHAVSLVGGLPARWRRLQHDAADPRGGVAARWYWADDRPAHSPRCRSASTPSGSTTGATGITPAKGTRGSWKRCWSSPAPVATTSMTTRSAMCPIRDSAATGGWCCRRRIASGSRGLGSALEGWT